MLLRSVYEVDANEPDRGSEQVREAECRGAHLHDHRGHPGQTREHVVCHDVRAHGPRH